MILTSVKVKSQNLWALTGSIWGIQKTLICTSKSSLVMNKKKFLKKLFWSFQNSIEDKNDILKKSL